MKRLEVPKKECPVCKKSFGRETCRQLSDFKEKKFCSHSCFTKQNVGNKHPYWKGGIKTRPDGYIRDSRTDRYIHRIVMENFIGRKLLPKEHVHHIDGNTSNNVIDNLLILTHSEHAKLEYKFRKINKNGQFA